MVWYKSIKRVFSIDGFYSAFRSVWDKDFSFNGESHDFWEAVYVKEGSVEVVENENIYLMSSGEIIFHAPMEFHRIRSADGSSPTVCVMSFSALGELPLTLREGVFSLEPSFSSEYEKIFRMALEYRSEVGSALLGQELAERLSLFLIKLSQKPSRAEVSMSQSAVEYRRIASFMLESVADNLTLAEIAERNNMSVSYIKLLFSTYAGVSPKSYYNQLRVNRATELLREGIGVSEIAALMNFSSPAYFSAFYKRQSGMSASEQRRSNI